MASDIETVRNELVELTRKLSVFEQQQNALIENVNKQVTEEVGKVTVGLQELYGQASEAIAELRNRLERVEGTGETRAPNRKSLVHAKSIIPEKITKKEEWKQWKSDVEDYCEEMFEGMKEMLEKTRKANMEVGEEWFTTAEQSWWERGEQLWRFLKRYTGGELKTIVQSVRMDNGWEAWRKLHESCEPGNVMREAWAMSRFTTMVNKRAKNFAETRSLMIELEDRARKIEDITGKRVDDRHAMSVIVSVVDMETMKHTAAYQGAGADIDLLKRKIQEFVNMMTGDESRSDPMDLGRVQEKECTHGEEEEWGEEWGYEEVSGEQGEEAWGVNALGGTCFNCGMPGHYARECPNGKGGKGKGKGGGKGFAKGKGKGKVGGKGKGKTMWSGSPMKGGGKAKGKGPQYGSCWSCGGAHYERECPWGKGGGINPWGKGGGARDDGAVRSLSSLREVESGVAESEGPAFQLVVSKRRRKQDKKTTIQTQNEKTTIQNEKTKIPNEKLSTLMEVAPEGVNSVETSEWEEIDMAIDSGATETVVGENMLTSIDTVEGEASRRGVQYEVASGTLIPNLGEKRFVAVGEGGEVRKMRAQVCSVNKALLSVKRMIQAGNRVVFDQEGSYVETVGTGERMYLREENGMYMLKMWVRRPF